MLTYNNNRITWSTYNSELINTYANVSSIVVRDLNGNYTSTRDISSYCDDNNIPLSKLKIPTDITKDQLVYFDYNNGYSFV